MKFVHAKQLTSLAIVMVLIVAAVVPLSAQQQAASDKYLHVKHEISTTGLPLFGAVVVYNSQDFQGSDISRSTRSSKITMGDSVVSDVSVVTICDLDKKTQVYINPKNKTWTDKEMLPSEFPVIDSAADANGPQMVIKKTGNSKEINGLKCEELYFKLDKSSNTGVGEAKVKHYFEGNMWVTKDIPNYQLYHEYNSRAQSMMRGTNYNGGGFFDILSRLDVDSYNLMRLINAVDGVPVEAAFVAQLPSATGGNVFETKIKLIEYSDKKIDNSKFTPPGDDYKKVPFTEYRSF
jgi:hypothetical protein